MAMRKSNFALLGVAVERAFSTYCKKLGDSTTVAEAVVVCRLRARARESKANKMRMNRARDIAFSIRN